MLGETSKASHPQPGTDIDGVLELPGREPYFLVRRMARDEGNAADDPCSAAGYT
jgi:hypothetical protein